MHSTDVGGTGSVPAFLTKLWKLVEDPKCDDLICWSSNGLSFFIHDQTRFSKELLPMYFKHSNMASFIRQLNMYGFRKMLNLDQGGLKTEKDTVEFYHQYFLKGQEKLLEYIKRKVPVPTSTSRGGPATGTASTSDNLNGTNAEVMREILTDVRAIRGKQDNVDSLLNSMKRENESLWREVAFLRQKHMKQQQVVEKLIHFLVTLVQPGNRNINVVQRKLPLMLYDSSSPNTSANSGSTDIPKLSRLSRQYSAPGTSNMGGPVIRDVTDSLVDAKFPSDVFEAVSSPIDPNLLNQEVLESSSLQAEQSPVPDQPLVNSPSIDSPLHTDEIMEPLSVLVPLQTPTNTILMSPSENEVLENEFLNSPSPVALSLNDLVETRESTENSNTDQKQNETMQRTSSPKTSSASCPSNVPLVATTTTTPQTLIVPDLIEATPSTSSVNNTNDRDKMTVALTDPAQLSLSAFSDHVENVDNELDWLTEQVSGNAFSFDTLLGLYGADDTVPGNNLPLDSYRFPKGDITGNEVVQYLPNLLETDTNSRDSTSSNLQQPQPQQQQINNDEFASSSPKDSFNISELLNVSREELYKNLTSRGQSNDNQAATQLQYISNLQQNPLKNETESSSISSTKSNYKTIPNVNNVKSPRKRVVPTNNPPVSVKKKKSI